MSISQDFFRLAQVYGERTFGEKGGMTMTLKLGPVATALGRFTFQFTDYEKPNRQIGIQLYQWVLRNFKSGGTMQTPAWLPLAERTQKEKAALGYSPLPLMRTGNLRQSFTPVSDSTQAGVRGGASVGVDYAQVHELGSRKKRIPARKMLPPESYALEVAIKIYDLHIKKSRRGAGL